MLVEAGQLGTQGVLLLGYHGKLIKLAGEFFTPITMWPMAGKKF
jgi:cobalamin biosynthesis protein CbiD